MILARLNKFFPLSIPTYGGLFISLSLILFGSIGWFALHQLTTLQIQTQQRNLELAKNELEFTVSRIIAETNKLANTFSQWEETRQQLRNSTYYSYWRDQRVKSANFIPTYFESIEIYDKSGKVLATRNEQDLPTQMTKLAKHGQFIKKNNIVSVLYFYPIVENAKSRYISGFVGVKVDFLKAIKSLQKFKYLDLKTMQVNAAEKTQIEIYNLLQHIDFDVIPNIEFNKLQTLIIETLSRFAMIAVVLGLLLLGLLLVLFAIPSRRLSQQIDALRLGETNLLHDLDKHKLPVAELEKVRLSLTDYQKQLDIRDEKLRDNEMRMRTVLDNVVDGILTLDQHGVIESSNAAAEKLFGYKNSELLGSSFISLFTEKTRQVYCEHYYCNIQTNQHDGNESCELVGQRKDNSEFPVELSLSKMNIHNRQLCIVVVRDITERKRAEEKLVYLANYDDLTGLPNRTLFRDRLSHAIARARRDDRLVALVFLDLDQFKKINDSMGHYLGDQLLLNISERLSKSLRDADTVSRLGGDEFLLILEGIKHVNEISHVVTKLLKTLQKPIILESQEVFITASAGITIFPFDDIEIEELVKNADTAMFKAKDLGGNTYQYYTANMNDQAMEKIKLESALRHALERNEFQIHYQPRIDLESGQMIGMEALLRWVHPEMGMVYPDKFIPLLEETGLIIPVGQWVLKTACEQTYRWHQLSNNKLRIAVNLSPRQFRHTDLVDQFCDILDNIGLDPTFLELEITESLLVENMDVAITVLQYFHNMGIHISIDDFGTGYSSLGYLKRFPIQTLKIDQSFVRDIIDDPDDAAITTAIVAMAKSLHLNVTAEGIETEEQLNYLRNLDCNEAQGYYFSKPLSAEDFEDFMLQKGKHVVNE